MENQNYSSTFTEKKMLKQHLTLFKTFDIGGLKKLKQKQAL